MKTKKERYSKNKNIFLFAILVFTLIIALPFNVQAKVFTIQNESVNMLVVNDLIFLTLYSLLFIRKIKEKMGSRNQADEPGKDFSRSNSNIFKQLYKSFAEKRSWVGEIRQTRLLEKRMLDEQVTSRSSGFKTQSFGLRVPDPALNKLTSAIAITSIFIILAALMLPILALPTSAKVFTIQNESVNMLVVNGTTGSILLNPNAGFGNVGIGTTS